MGPHSGHGCALYPQDDCLTNRFRSKAAALQKLLAQQPQAQGSVQHASPAARCRDTVTTIKSSRAVAVQGSLPIDTCASGHATGTGDGVCVGRLGTVDDSLSTHAAAARRWDTAHVTSLRSRPATGVKSARAAARATVRALSAPHRHRTPGACDGTWTCMCLSRAHGARRHGPFVCEPQPVGPVVPQAVRYGSETRVLRRQGNAPPRRRGAA